MLGFVRVFRRRGEVRWHGLRRVPKIRWERKVGVENTRLECAIGESSVSKGRQGLCHAGLSDCVKGLETVVLKRE